MTVQESLEWVWQRVKYRKGDEIGAQKGEREIERSQEWCCSSVRKRRTRERKIS